MTEPVKEQINGASKQPVPTVGVGNKEGGVTARVEASESLPVIEDELKGIIKAEEPQVPHDPKVGISASGPSTPVSTQPSASISLPMTEEEVEQVLKEKKSSYHLDEYVGEKAGIATEDSKPFLAMILRKVFQKMRILTRKPA